MKFSYHHLQKFTPLPKANDLVELINTHITEVEGIEKRTYSWPKVVVAEILEIKPHPHADKLQLVKVTYGSGKVAEVVCGAKNIAIGQKVPLALLGAKIQGETLKPAEIRGVKSEGMLCSEAELGLGGDSEGILILDSGAKESSNLQEALGLPKEDFLIDLKVLSNRPDFASYIGLAREIAAVQGKNFDEKVLWADFKVSPKSHFKIRVDVPKLCPSYFGVVASGVSFKPSPFWLKNLLEISNFQSLGGVVDLTNLILLEVGQPLHAFDREKLTGDQIKVRMAKENEKLVGLDGKTYELKASDLVIADEGRAQALAGIVGDERSAVAKETHLVIFESATFDLYSLRRASRRLGLRTEALGRFERGLPYFFARAGVARLLKLLSDFAPGAEIEEIVEVSSKQYLPRPKKLIVGLDGINMLYQKPFSRQEAKRILGTLGFKASFSGQRLKVEPAPWRLDIKEAADITEELGRIEGVNKIESSMPLISPVAEYEESPLGWQYSLKTHLAGAGLNELKTHSFTSPETYQKTGFVFDEKKHIQLANPLSSEWTYMRGSLVPSLLMKASENLRHEDSFRVFELSKVFRLGEEEKWSLAIVLADKKKDLFFDAKGIVESLGRFYGLEFGFGEGERNLLSILFDKVVVGKLYRLDREIAYNLDLPAATIVGEIEIEKILISQKAKTFKPYSRFPGVSFDIAILVDEKYKATEIGDYLRGLDPLIVKAEAFDLYVGKEIPKGKKSLAFRIFLQSFEKTLTDKETKAVEKRIQDGLIRHFQAEIR